MARTHQQKKSNQDMVLAKAEKRPLCPDFAKLRYITNEHICLCQIHGSDSGWHKELMLRTWEGDYDTYKDVVTDNWTAVDNWQHDTVGDLAHACGKKLKEPCTNCKAGPTHYAECRINAIWPVQICCTSCARIGKFDSCSLQKDIDLREKLFSNSAPTSDSQKNEDLYKIYCEASKAFDDAKQALQTNSEDQLAMVNTAVSALANGVKKLAELQLPGTMIKRELD